MQLSPMATAARLGSALNTKFQVAGRVASSGDQKVEGLNLLGHAAGHDNSNALLMWPPTPPSKSEQNAAQLGTTEQGNREREDQGESGGQ